MNVGMDSSMTIDMWNLIWKQEIFLPEKEK